MLLCESNLVQQSGRPTDSMSQFRLSSPDQEFNNRVDGLFSCLDSVTTRLPDDGLVFDSSSSGVKITTRTMRDLVAEDADTSVGGFKRPTSSNIPTNKRFKNNARPGYVINPNKWTRYNMKDTEVLNDSQNKKSALQLMADLKNRKDEQSSEDITGTDSEQKIVFKRPSHQKMSQHFEDDAMEDSECQQQNVDISADFGGTKKFVMDEYVVGSKKKKSKKNKGSKAAVGSNTGASEVKLSYLDFEDDECD